MIKRERYMERIRPFIGNELIKVLTGLRRSGKSVMLELIQDEILRMGASREQFVSINFEQMDNAGLCTAEALHEELKRRISGIRGKAYLFLDEIQEVERWEKCVNSCRVDFDCDIYITGSNAKLLSGELATYLAGRYVEFVVYPFSFEEFLEMSRQRNPGLGAVEAFRSYIQLGGMPFLTHLIENREACAQYLRELYNSVILKDVVSRVRIRDVDLLERIVAYVVANVGHPFSAYAISKYFKNEKRAAAHDTVLNYVRACTDAFLFNRISCADLIGKKILSVNEKYYVADHGIREAVYGQNMRDVDQVLENIVCTDMLRRGYSVNVGRNGAKEIDFVASRGADKLYVQVAYLLAGRETVEREFGAYKGIPDNFPKYVVSSDEFDMGRDGIKHFNIRDFLLMKEWD